MFFEYLTSNPLYFFTVVVTVVLSICLHELAHGLVAVRCGDRTPIETGHLTLNPLVHMGPVSLVMLALAGIAWGLMPVNPSRMRGRRAPALVALAGPATNAALAVLSLTAVGVWIRFTRGTYPAPLVYTCWFCLRIFGTVNIALLLLNLIPIPPLDGSRVLANFSSAYARLMHRLMQNGQAGIAFLVLFYFGGERLSQTALFLARQYVIWLRG